MSARILKVNYKDDIRRLSFPNDAKFAQVRNAIAERFGLDSKSITIHHKDDEGDLIAVSSDSELQEIFEYTKSQASVRLVVAVSSAGWTKVDGCGEKKEEVDRSDEDDAKQRRKHSKKHCKKEEKLAKLKQELLEELRKDLGPQRTTTVKVSSNEQATETETTSSGAEATPQQSAGTQLPTGEHLQALVQALVDASGMPGEMVFGYLNELTPEKIKDSFTCSGLTSTMTHLIHRLLRPHGGPPPYGPPHHFGPPPFHGPFWAHPSPPPSYQSPPVSATSPNGNVPAPSAPPPQGDFQHAAYAGAGVWQPTGGCPWRYKQGHRHYNWFSGPPTVRYQELVPPPAPLHFGSVGDEVAALQKVLWTLGYLRCGPWYLDRKRFDYKTHEALVTFQMSKGLGSRSFYDDETRVALAAAIEALQAAAAASEKASTAGSEQNAGAAAGGAAAAAGSEEVVEIVDTDGDVMVFHLAEDRSRVVEYVNGALELDRVEHLAVDESTGLVRDAKGIFYIKECERAAKLAALRALLRLVGVEVAALAPPAPPTATVEIDLDLNAPPEKLAEQQRQGLEAIRRACASLGTSPDEAVKFWSNLFGDPAESAAQQDQAREQQPVAGEEVNAPEEETGEWQWEDGAESVGKGGGFEYEPELVAILEMGFDGPDCIRDLLIRYQGDVSRVVQALAEAVV